MEYKEALKFLYEQLPMYQRMGKAAMKADLSNTLALSESLGNPYKSYKTIHIAGTNGKGSTSHMFASILQEAGYKVGLYTSPHLKTFRERIRVDGQMISESYISSFVSRMRKEVEEIEPSFFEITVIMAFEYFKSMKVDFAIIETGLGGRLDSTNVIHPIMSVITSISLDHEDLLGKGIRNISKEKGGIIKQNVPVVVGDLDIEALEELERISQLRNAKFINNTRLYNIEENETSSLVEFKDQVKTFESELVGDSFNLNIPTVLEGVKCLQSQGVAIDDICITSGINMVISNTGLKGRWQVISDSPLTICDVGHNIEAVTNLMKRLLRLVKKTSNLHIVWGMTLDKSTDEILKILIPDANYYFCAADIPRSLDADKLSGLAKAIGLKGESYKSVENAYNEAKKQSDKNDILFVGGSTFVVAELKSI